MPFFLLKRSVVGEFCKIKYPQNSQIFKFSSRRSEFCRNDDFSRIFEFLKRKNSVFTKISIRNYIIRKDVPTKDRQNFKIQIRTNEYLKMFAGLNL